MVVDVQHGPPKLRAFVLHRVARRRGRGARVCAKKSVQVLIREAEVQNSAIEEQTISCEETQGELRLRV